MVSYFLLKKIFKKNFFQTEKKTKLKFLLKKKYALFIAENAAFRPDLGKTVLFEEKKVKKGYKIQNLETFNLFFNLIFSPKVTP